MTRQLGVQKKTRRSDVSKATWRALHEIARAWVHSEQYARCHALNGIYGAQHGRLCSWWRFDEPDRADQRGRTQISLHKTGI